MSIHQNKQRFVLVAGGDNGDWILDMLHDNDGLVGVDRGAWFLLQAGRFLDLAIGDFDSVTEDQKAEIRQHTHQLISVDAIDKDQTDMEMAVNWAMKQHPSELILTGATGGRLDHTLANLQLLIRCHVQGVHATLIDNHNRIRHQAAGKLILTKDSKYPYISILACTPIVENVTIQGFQYPLSKAQLRMDSPSAISNRLIADEGHITIGSGSVWVIESNDKQ